MRLSRSARRTVRRHVGTERHDLHPERGPLLREPVEQLGRLDALDHGEDVVPALGHPGARPLPAAEVRQGEDDTLPPREPVGRSVRSRRSARVIGLAPARTSAGRRSISTQYRPYDSNTPRAPEPFVPAPARA